MGNRTMKRFEVLVVERGKLANELIEELHGKAISRAIRWEDRATSLSESRIVVHAGSGHELPEVIADYAATQTALSENPVGHGRNVSSGGDDCGEIHRRRRRALLETRPGADARRKIE